MIKSLFNVTAESFLMLRRDKIFFPALIGGILMILLANLASDWSVAEFDKVLFDVGFFCFHFLGSIVALFWGAKSVADAKKDGQLEVELTSPVDRRTWLIGKYLGLCLSLILLGISLIVFWQVAMILNKFGLMSGRQFVIFLMLILNWLVLAALAIFFSTVCGSTVALFSSVCFWFVGLGSSATPNFFGPQTSPMIKETVGFVAKVWDLQKLNLTEFAVSIDFPSLEEIIWRCTYGAILILIILTVTSVIFNRKDLC